MYDPKTEKFTLIRTCFRRTIWSSPRTPTTRCGPAPAGRAAACVGWLDTQDVRGDRRRGRSRRAGRRSSSTPTATASATTTSSRTSRSIRRRTSASSAALYGIGVKPGRRLDLGLGADGYPGLRRSASIPGAESAGDRARGSLRAAARRGYGPRGMRHRPQRRRLGAARERPHRRASTARKCKGPLNGPDRDRQALPGRLDALSVARPAVRGVDRRRAAPRRATTPGSISSTRSASARTCRSRPATSTSRCSRWWTASGSTFACPIRWASTPSGWTGASTIRTPAGRARASGRPIGTRTPFHIEGGKGTRPKVVKFQLRPDPLAR